MSGSRNEFPPQTGPYAVKVKNGAGWREHKTARLQISVGQPYHEGEKLAATLEWCRHRFDHVIICVNDTLQRFNHEFDGMSAREAYFKALGDGTGWIERNRAAIERLPSVEIHRWEDWKTWPDFAMSMLRTQELMRTNSEFRDAIRENIAAFWERRKPDAGLAGQYRFAEFARLSEQYLLEETAVFAIMFRKQRAVDVYPGSVLLPCVIFQGRDVKGAPEGLGEGAFTRIDFSRRKGPTPEAA